ncbi:hypothetical protein [Prescottella equi]
MTADGWDGLSAAIPELVFIDFDDTLTIPPDPVAAQQVLSVLQTQPLWFPLDSNEQRFETSRWSPTHSEPIELREISASVVAVMRDGLGMELERIRYTAGDEDGYGTGRGRCMTFYR